MRRLAFATAVLLGAGSPALAQALDLAKPYGNALGCARRDGGGAGDDERVYLTPEKIVMAASTCTIVQKLSAPDGTLIALTLCDLEGEEGRSIAHFSISVSKANPANLEIFDEYGARIDEVAPCP